MGSALDDDTFLPHRLTWRQRIRLWFVYLGLIDDQEWEG